MKKISKWCWIASALLLIWAARGLYDYLTMGRPLLAQYPDIYSVREMVKGDLIRILLKVGLAILLPLVGFWRSRRKPPKALTAVTELLTAAVMGTWLISMGVLTVVTAQEIYDSMYDQAADFAAYVDQHGDLSVASDSEDLEHRMLLAISRYSTASYQVGGHYESYDPSTGLERSKLLRSIPYPMETAVLFYDGTGRLLHSSEDNVMFFGYYTQEEWNAGQDGTYPAHHGWIDISEGKGEGSPNDPYLLFRNIYAGTHSLYDIASIRVTGYFEGTRLDPVVMHYVTDGEIRQVVEQDSRFRTGSSSYAWKNSDVDRTGKLDWQLQFDRSAEYEGKELVTVYLDHPEMWDYPQKPYVYTNGVGYKSLAALAKKRDFPSWAEIGYHSPDLIADGCYELKDLLMFGGRTYRGADPTAPELFLVTAVHGNPLGCAVGALRNIYLITALLAAALLLLARRVIRIHLVQPVKKLADAMENGWRTNPGPEEVPAKWQEIKRLNAGFEAERDLRRMKDNEISRISTALTYAKAAEENRRRMTSSIAHEMKTPLAVIHSYAEGLKEQIAPEKQEKYLDTILSEAERTDAIVLEMLDLSRLEAGKVKLARDDFDLAEMIRHVFDRMTPQIQEKALTVELDLPRACPVTGDQSRMAQVVGNFVSNAVKYTAQGGSIHVQIRTFHHQILATFRNTGKPFSQEALAHIWDSFYRVDSSRSDPGGTGLGLAIARQIVELHGGTCSVKNLQNEVEFSFTLPI